MCANCGAAVEVFDEDGKKISEGYSPFTAEKYSVGQPNDIPASSDKTKDTTS
ncbi:hypothetical protein ACFLXK_01325 [Chloroflexota bacterium]